MNTSFSPELIYPLFKKLAKKLTHGDSSSIPYAKAMQLMSSIVYCLEEPHAEFLDITPTHSSSDLEMLYHVGLARKKKKLDVTFHLYKEICDSFIDYGNHAYYETVIKGFPHFFDWYDVELDARNHLLTLDYPLYQPLPNHCGIDLIYDYLTKLSIEISFLSQLPEMFIHKILNDYHPDSSELFINLPQLVLKHGLCCMLLDIPLASNLFNGHFYPSLGSLVLSMPTNALTHKLEHLLEKFIFSLFSNNAEDFDSNTFIRKTLKYFCMNIQTLSSDLKICASNNCLGQFF